VTDSNEHDLGEIRRLLSARESGCWLRLEDALSELVAVHGVPEDEILARVRELTESERLAAQTGQQP
jgi:hypothetical protein